MAVQKRTTPSGKIRWVARYRDKTGREHSKSFGTQREAKTHLADQQAAMARNEWVDPSTNKTTLHDLATEWADEAVATGTRKDRLQLAANLGDLAVIPINQSDDRDLTRWISQLRHGRPWAAGRPYKERTVRNKISQTRALLNRAADRGLVQRGVGAVLRNQPHQPMEIDDHRLPTAQEVQTLVDRAPTWFSQYVQLAVHTGMRSGEVAGLQWQDVDFDRGLIKVRRQAGRNSGETRVLKSRTSRRDIPLSAALRVILLGWGVGNPGEPVVVRPCGEAPTASRISEEMVRSRKKLGVRPEVSFHGFRHFFASTLLAEGVPLQIVSKALGHASIAVTASTYAHFMPGQWEQTREAMGAFAGFVRDSAPTLRVVGGSDLQC